VIDSLLFHLQEARRILMNFDGFLYVFALIGIVTTAVAGSLGVALTLTMARFTYERFKLVGPLLFSTNDVIDQLRTAHQRGATLDGPMHEPASKYTERMPVATNEGRKVQA